MKKITPRQDKIKLPETSDKEKACPTRNTEFPQLDKNIFKKSTATITLTGENLDASPGRVGTEDVPSHGSSSTSY